MLWLNFGIQGLFHLAKSDRPLSNIQVNMVTAMQNTIQGSCCGSSQNDDVIQLVLYMNDMDALFSIVLYCQNREVVKLSYQKPATFVSRSNWIFLDVTRCLRLLGKMHHLCARSKTNCVSNNLAAISPLWKSAMFSPESYYFDDYIASECFVDHLWPQALPLDEGLTLCQ